MFSKFIIFLTVFLFLQSCTTSKKLETKENISDLEKGKLEIKRIIFEDSTFSTSHTGLLVRKLGETEDIIDIKASHYFTPASNTKLLTFLTCLKVLGDQVNGLKVYENSDSIVIWGTGDPSFLNPYLEVNDFISERLNSSEKAIYFSSSNFQDARYGSGWSWDDYNYGYQAEKHSLPMYGNFVNYRKSEIGSRLEISPTYFETLTYPNIESQRSTIIRNEKSNLFYYDYYKLKEASNVNRNLPYITSSALQGKLLSLHLGKEVELIKSSHHVTEADNLKSVQVDSLYKLLLQPSDNFVAEQLLLNCGSELFDTLNTRKVIDWARENVLVDMPNGYQWVDGSGLSRYNMTTPSNMVHVLELIYPLMDRERLFRLLPTGGESGTIRNLYAAEKPFIHAKTGSLRNNHSLSGYLIGDSGETYVFSFMNSNFLVSNSELKKGMDRVLRILKSNL